MPELAMSSMTLELPESLHPDPSSGPWIGPEPAPTSGHATWRLAGAGGKSTLRLRDRAEDASAAESPRIWLEGPTRIDLNAAPANWTAEWTMEESPGAPRRLTIELDPGLDLIDVSGPRVASFRVEPGPGPTRVVVRLEGDGQGASPLTLRAICQPPVEGTWAIPSARPVDAAWTGGRTTVRLDPSRVLQACRSGSSRRVPTRPEEAGSSLATLAFEPDGGPGPLAELSFRRPTAEATVQVRGLLLLGDDLPRLQASITWGVESGRLLNHSVELPPGWTPDRALSSGGESIPWHADPMPGGGLRVRMTPPAQDGEARALTMTLAASAREGGIAGPIDLPRVRPSPMSGRLVDEVWVASAATGTSFRPILGRGLAWIDPPDPARDPTPVPWTAADLDGALAWRWLVDDAEGRVDRSQNRGAPRADVLLDAAIGFDRLRLDWTLTLELPQGWAGPVPIHLGGPDPGPLHWRLGGPDGPTIEARPIPEPRRSSIGLPPGGSALDLDLPGPRNGPIVCRARAEHPWGGARGLPILTLPDPFRTRGLVAIRSEDTARLRVDQEGLISIDLAGSPEGGISTRRGTTFLYDRAGGRIDLATSPGQVSPAGAVIAEAVLTTRLHPGEGSRNRLTLRIAPGLARELTFKMPPGTTLDRTTLDGRPVDARPDGSSFRVVLPGGDAGQAPASISLDYRAEGASRSSIEPSALLPVCPLPCLSFVWELSTPDHWSLRAQESGLTDADPRPDPSWAGTLLGLPPNPWFGLDRKVRPGDREAILLDLDKPLASLPGGETNLGDWLLKVDSGRWPIVVDRLGLLSMGLGPDSRVNLPNPPGARVAATLAAIGLAATPVEGVILVGPRDAGPVEGRAGLASWSKTLDRAAKSGSDEADRFQSASRWRGEATPTSGPRIVDPEDASGWATRRFVADGWPTQGASVRLLDGRADRARGWLVAAAVLAGGVIVRGLSRRTRALGDRPGAGGGLDPAGPGMARSALVGPGAVSWSTGHPGILARPIDPRRARSDRGRAGRSEAGILGQQPGETCRRGRARPRDFGDRPGPGPVRAGPANPWPSSSSMARSTPRPGPIGWSCSWRTPTAWGVWPGPSPRRPWTGSR